MTTTVALGFGKRDRVGGPITRLSGRFTTNFPGAQFGEVFVTDCKRYVRLGNRVPVARPAFSIPRPELTNKTRRLNSKANWYVYVKVKNRRTRKEEFSNAIEFPATKKTRRDTGKTITQVKKANLAAIRRAIREGNQEIRRMNREAQRLVDRALKLSELGIPFLPDWLLERAEKITDEMAKLRRQLDQLEKDAAARKADLQKRFGVKSP